MITLSGSVINHVQEPRAQHSIFNFLYKHLHGTPMRLFIRNPHPPSHLRNISDEKETNDGNHTTITSS